MIMLVNFLFVLENVDGSRMWRKCERLRKGGSRTRGIDRVLSMFGMLLKDLQFLTLCVKLEYPYEI